MSIFLRWEEEKPYSKNKFTSNLFSRISPYWYPTNVIGSSIYSIFESYADQLSSLSIHSNVIFNDFSIYTSRISSVSDIYNFKLYSNFSSFYNLSPLENQLIDIYTSSSSLMSFRNNTSLLINSTFGATTKYGIEKLGQSFTGVSPNISELVKKYEGWKLKFSTCSVLTSGDSFFVTQERVLDNYNIIPSSYVFSNLYPIHYSLTKLGVNTKVYSKKHLFSGLDITVYGSESVNLRNTLNPLIKSVIRGDQYSNLFFSDNYKYYRASSHPTSSLISVKNDYLYNTQPTKDYSITGSVIELPNDCSNYEWKYDWSVRTYNESDYDMFVRWYPSSSIPDSVYFTQINSKESISYLPVNEDLYYTKYVNNNSLGLFDLSRYHSNNLFRVYSYGTSSIYRRARNQQQITPFKSHYLSNLHYSGSLNYPSGFFNSFYFEFWVNGIDNTFVDSSIKLKYQNTSSNLFSNIISNIGYLISIDSSTQSFSISSKTVNNSGSVSCSILPYLQEECNRWHCFSGTLVSSSIYLYIDGNLQATGSLPYVNMITGSAGFSINGYNSSGVDEIAIHQGFLSPDLALEHFNMSKPRLSSNMILASGSMYKFHQPMIRMKASGSSEIEFHEFSIRGNEGSIYSLHDKYFIDSRQGVIPIPEPIDDSTIRSSVFFGNGEMREIGEGIISSNTIFNTGEMREIGEGIISSEIMFNQGSSSIIGEGIIYTGVEFLIS